MVKELISRFSELMVIGLSGAFLSNAVLCRAMGLDRIKNIEEDSDEIIFCILQFACSMLTSLLFGIAKKLVYIPASLLEKALRLYQGRALYDGDLPEEALKPLSEKYGLIY